MFWKRKSKQRAQEEAQIINVYLIGAMPLILTRLKVPAARAGAQIFILGMVDMLRQVKGLSMDEFVAVYSFVLDAHGLQPTIPVTEFIDAVGQAASSEQKIEQIISEGAQSLRMYVAERDAEAPIDLSRAVIFAESNEALFTAIPGASE